MKKNYKMTIDTEINLDYLIPELRFKLGDIDPANYRYLDGWLRVSLVSSVKALQRWWKDKYLIDDTNNVYRNLETTVTFTQDEPPVLQESDERPIVLMAAILVKDGTLQSNSWSLGSWRDAEYSVSNIEGGKIKEASLKRDWDELLYYLTPPTKRLSSGTRIGFNFGADETT